MPNLFQHNGRWVTASQLRAFRNEEKQEHLNEIQSEEETVKEAQSAVEEEVTEEISIEEQDVSIEELRANYKESHPENKNVSPRYANDVEYMKKKIAEFTK